MPAFPTSPKKTEDLEISSGIMKIPQIKFYIDQIVQRLEVIEIALEHGARREGIVATLSSLQDDLAALGEEIHTDVSERPDEIKSLIVVK